MSSWGPEVQNGVLDMVELLVDLIAARLSYTPIPLQLLETLAILFDQESAFHRKNRSKSYDRPIIKPTGDQIFTYSFGHSAWLCRVINRFVSQSGIVNLKKLFESEQPLSATVNERFLIIFCSFISCLPIGI